MKASARTFLRAGAGALLLQAGLLHADDKAAPAAKAPDIHDYQPSNVPQSPDSSINPGSMPGQFPSTAPEARQLTPEEKQAQEKERNWLFNNIADQQKAAANAAKGLPPDAKDEKAKPDATSALAPYATVSLTPGAPAGTKKDGPGQDPNAAKNGTGSDTHTAKSDTTPPPSKDGLQTVSPNTLSSASTEGLNDFKPLIKGLSSDTSKPLSGTSTIKAPAPIPLDGKLLGGPINPDLIKPVDLGGPDGGRNDRSGIPAGSVVLAPMAADTGRSSFDAASAPSPIPTFNPTSFNNALSAPSAPSNPMAPSLSLIAAINPIQAPAPIVPISIPTAPPAAPTAYQMAPTAGPSKVRVKDPNDFFLR